MYINMLNTINRHMSIPVMPVVDAAQGIVKTKFEDHAELPTFTSVGATKDPDIAYRYTPYYITI